MIYLWKLNGDELELNLPEILKYTSLAKIYSRDTMAGKVSAKREFKYIDFLANRDSFCVLQGLSKEEAHKFAKKHSRLPKDWAPDEYLVKAIECAKSLNGGIIEDLIDATVTAFRVDARMMSKLKDLLEVLENKVTDVEGVLQVTKLTDTISNVAGTIPNKINKLLELREEYAKAQSKQINEKRGGGEIGNSLDGSGIEQYSDTGIAEKLD